MDKKEKSPGKKGKSPVPFIIAAFVALVVVLAVTGKLPLNEKEKGRSFNLSGKETGAVLDPSNFTGMTRLAYEAAKQYPDALNEVFCYCYCNKPPFKHKSLLSCFVDKHGAG